MSQPDLSYEERESKSLGRLIPKVCLALGAILAAAMMYSAMMAVAQLFGIGPTDNWEYGPLASVLIVMPFVFLFAFSAIAIGQTLYCLYNLVFGGWSLKNALRIHFVEQSFSDWCKPIKTVPHDES